MRRSSEQSNTWSSRPLSKLLRGRRAARSEGPGRGSEFVVRLPAIEPPAEPMEQPTAAARVQRRRIVVIEDNEDLRLTLRALLELDGHEVHEAADGKSGAELILRVRPEVALVDAVMATSRISKSAWLRTARATS